MKVFKKRIMTWIFVAGVVLETMPIELVNLENAMKIL
jgi:hypothetical protein